MVPEPAWVGDAAARPAESPAPAQQPARSREAEGPDGSDAVDWLLKQRR